MQIYILFDLFVLTVNLNLYCSSEALEVRANRLYCVCLTSVNYGHCSFPAFAQDRAVETFIDKFQHESSVFAGRLPRGQSKFSNYNYATG